MRMTRWSVALSSLLLGPTIALPAGHARADSPFATEVVSYQPGLGGASGYSNPASALGAPERFTGEGLIPGAVTPFQPAFLPNEIVSLGLGGSLVVAFDHPVENDPRNPFGIDLLVFGNAFFTDASGGAGVVAGLASEGGTISVSADGIDWFTVRGVEADGMFPTLGYLDASPFSVVPGVVESDFLRPVDPKHSFATLAGVDFASLVDLYDGSGGGAGIDIAFTGLASIRFVRVDGPAIAGLSPEIDAFADVAPDAVSPDFDGDGTVGPADLAALLAAWGSTDAARDLDGDGLVGSPDLAILLSSWGSGGRP